MPKRKITIEQNPDDEVPAKLLATAIRDCAEGFQKMKQSGLTEKAIRILVAHASGLSQHQVEMVMRGMDDLKRLYLK